MSSYRSATSTYVPADINRAVRTVATYYTGTYINTEVGETLTRLQQWYPEHITDNLTDAHLSETVNWAERVLRQRTVHIDDTAAFQTLIDFLVPSVNHRSIAGRSTRR